MKHISQSLVILAVLWLAQASFGQTLLLSDGFETVNGTSNLTTGPWPDPASPPWTSTASNDQSIAVYNAASGDPVFSGTESLRLKTLPSSAPTISAGFISQTTGFVQMSLEMYVPSAVTDIRTVSVQLGAGSSSAAYLTLFTLGGLGYFDSTNTFHKIADSILDQWVNLSVVINVVAKTYSVSYDGVSYGQSFTYNKSTASISKITLLETTQESYLDNILVQAVPEPGSVALVGLGAFALVCFKTRKLIFGRQ